MVNCYCGKRPSSAAALHRHLQNQLDPVAGDFFYPISISIWEALSMASHPLPELLEFQLFFPILQLI